MRAVESRSPSELSGTAPAASVLGCLFSVGQLDSTSLFLNRIWDFSTASSHLHWDCGTCPCVVTRSSTILLVNCGWATQLSSASAGPSGPVCACSCGASFITATVSSKIDSGTSTSMICSSIHPKIGSGTSTSMICSTIRSGTCSWHVIFVCEQPSSLV